MSTLEPAAQPKPFKLWLSQLQMKHGRKLVIALLYIWLILLFLLPFLIVFKISLAEMARAIPPYTELMEWADGQLSITPGLYSLLRTKKRSTRWRMGQGVNGGAPSVKGVCAVRSSRGSRVIGLIPGEFDERGIHIGNSYFV